MYARGWRALVPRGMLVGVKLETLEDVVRAGYDVLAVVVQDEYTHDVVATGPTPGFFVFDTT